MFFRWAFFISLLLIIPVPMVRQIDVRPIVVAQFPLEDPITFTAIYPDGTTIPLGTLPIEFYESESQVQRDTEGIIWGPDRIAISPDQQYAAFSAGRGGEYQLFVFKTTGEFIWSSAIETPVLIEWKPDSTGFALITDSAFTPSDLQVGIAYFDLNREEIIQLAAPEHNRWPRQLEWINSNTLSFVFRDPDGDTLNTITRNADRIELMRTRHRLQENRYGSICEREWSEVLQLFFVVTNCTGSPESIILEQLYTVDLAGNTTVLLTAPDEYRNDQVNYAHYSINGIELHNQSLFVLLQEYRESFTGDYDTRDSPLIEVIDRWRLLRWLNGEWTELASGTHDESYHYLHPRISPDGRYLALGLYRWILDGELPSYLVIYDLETGEIIRQFEVNATYSNSLVWFNHYQFLYSTSLYSANDPMMSRLAQIVDLSRLPREGVIILLEHPIWLSIDD